MRRPENPENVAKLLEKLRFRERKPGDHPVVFVSGSWQAERAITISPEAYKFGKFLAELGVHMSVGPGTGVARYVIDGYRSVANRGHVIFYLPKESEMERVGEAMEEGADEIYHTELDYPLRNLIQVKESSAVVAIGGSAGTVTEIVAAAFDYNKPTIVLKKGEAYKALKSLSDVRGNINFASSVEEAVQLLREKLLKVA